MFAIAMCFEDSPRSNTSVSAQCVFNQASPCCVGIELISIPIGGRAGLVAVVVAAIQHGDLSLLFALNRSNC